MNPATISLSVNAYGKLIIWMWLGAPPMIHWAGRIFLHSTRLSYEVVVRSANDLTWRHMLHFIRACELPTGVLRVAAPASGLTQAHAGYRVGVRPTGLRDHLMKPESPTKPPVRRMKDGELKELLGDGVMMFTVGRPRASSPDTSASPVNSRRPPSTRGSTPPSNVR